LLLAKTVVDTMARWVVVALVGTVMAGLLLAAGFVDGGVVATYFGLAIGTLGTAGLFVDGHRKHPHRPARSRAAGS
jgi:hypothetical protein